ncbi:ABC transporter substrate-binding protein [Pseudolysinimonas sp.]|uniref:ABC transporter substrate-binding protein n=1 Tax=Pseudolysinimonas sp. TaxID=2680009 RepID=UPI00286A1CC0|nr:ABC transporter substrate-binding protein [Pseudolysinimonas sp.]
MPRPFARAAVTAVAVGALLALAGCGGAPTPSPPPAPTPTPPGDGELKIGTLFPSSGGVAFIGPAQVAGVNAAIREINAAGGVNGAPVVVVNRDSGDASTQKVEESFADLVTQGVDVVIGPSSSVLSQRLLEPAAEADIPLISPAATYPQLTALDTEGIFFRTIPSYPHQAIVLADLFADRDVESVAIVFRDDDLGSSLSAALAAALEATEIELEAVEVAADANAEALAEAVATVKEAAPDAVVLSTPDNGDQTKALITQLSAAGFGGAKLWLTSQNLADYSQALPAGLLNGVNGVIEGAETDAAFQAKIKQEDPAVADFRYAAEAYDATVLAALAAVLAADDGGASIARLLGAASVDGIKCTSFGECVDVLRTQTDIDYDGLSGSTNLDAEGDPQRGTYVVVAYNAENKYARQAVVVG